MRRLISEAPLLNAMNDSPKRSVWCAFLHADFLPGWVLVLLGIASLSTALVLLSVETEWGFHPADMTFLAVLSVSCVWSGSVFWLVRVQGWAAAHGDQYGNDCASRVVRTVLWILAILSVLLLGCFVAWLCWAPK